MIKLDANQKLSIIQDALEEIKADDIEVMHLEGRTLIADYFIVASGTSNIHIRSIVDKVIEKLKAQKVRPYQVEGYNEAKWVLVDYGDVVLHVFAKEEREFYDLESLWRATGERLEQTE